MHTWDCPLCDAIEGRFERQTKVGLDIAIASHIIRHEERSGLRAVDRARLGCTETTCSLGKNRCYDPTAKDFVPRMTDFDRKLLIGMKVKLE